MEEIGEEEANELKGHGDGGVPEETKQRADWHAVEVDFIGAAKARGEDGGLPVGRSLVCSSLFVGLIAVLAYRLEFGYGGY